MPNRNVPDEIVHIFHAMLQNVNTGAPESFPFDPSFFQNMPYCQRCGELGRSDKCQKCGNRLLPNTSVALFWKKRDSVSPAITPISTTSYRVPDTASCKKCHQPLSGKTVQLCGEEDESNSTSKTYHWSCLQCVKCSKPFQTTSFYLDSNQHVYHTEVTR